MLTPFLRSLLERGLDISQALLVIIDGGKGLQTAVKKAFRKRVLIQRCQWHKRENVVSYLSKGEQPASSPVIGWSNSPSPSTRHRRCSTNAARRATTRFASLVPEASAMVSKFRYRSNLCSTHTLPVGGDLREGLTSWWSAQAPASKSNSLPRCFRGIRIIRGPRKIWKRGHHHHG